MNPFHVFTLAAQNHMDLLIALDRNPEDGICAFCGDVNTFVDDIGFFYCWPLGLNGYFGPACRECYNGPVGIMHRAIHGIGER